ncbi:16S rRNA (cytosine(1402)-N(4))-methyltransferase RsmH [Vallitalea sp.]|jgi:16S rRNA (cytosine1402-N4)-methyltransferase|uniref:16S rRNA (cytosine(1402)-N(4))-methyltransferase RsmH n=1 Tax=Vallitalea sp. TaxID=1882829 RepID=UPI0025FE374E|nr:16S rRNA (cytosine(1402)-N(4))-methyltransferase RsmH [Vallitalea sp.]MCT4688194.1 16S rRNA (cytosine(1402)-N(4))-methyltransferase RsmH [Vallitalea sp.]
MAFQHKSVLLEECIEGLNIKPNGIYIDGTLGGAGHSYEICRKLNRDGLLIGIDQDENAINASTMKLAEYKDIVRIHRANFSEFESVLNEEDIPKVDGILLDLGVSSHQLDTAERGFSYMKEAPLDMRMDTRQTATAADIINNYEEEELYKVIRTYGEEKWASRIVKNIVVARQEKPIKTTLELVDIIRKSIPKKAMQKGGHPAKRTFQAIRIELNEELNVLKDTLDDMVDRLNDGGRLCIITFHSLEDRIVKRAFKDNNDPCTCPPDFPICVCNKKSKGKIITRKPIIATEEELSSNNRSKSAKLRIFEKVEV